MNYKEKCLKDFKELVFKLNAMIDKIEQLDNNKENYNLLDDMFNLINDVNLSANIKTTLKFIAMYNMNKQE